jgi:hypothetical protein
MEIAGKFLKKNWVDGIGKEKKQNTEKKSRGTRFTG